MLNAAPPPILDPAARAEVEQAYAAMLSALVVMARMLGKPCPVKTRDERRREGEEGR